MKAQSVEEHGGRIRWKLIEKKYNVTRNSIKHFVKNKKMHRTRAEACKVRAKTLSEEDIVREEYLFLENYKGNFPSRDAFLKTANDLLRLRQIREQ
jgi:hypothetical protein